MVEKVGNYGYVVQPMPQRKSKAGAVTGAVVGAGLGAGAVAKAFVSGATKRSIILAGDGTNSARLFKYAPSVKGFMKYCKDFVNNPFITIVTSTKGSIASKLSKLAMKLPKAGRAGALTSAIVLPVAAGIGICKFIGSGIDKMVNKE